MPTPIQVTRYQCDACRKVYDDVVEATACETADRAPKVRLLVQKWFQIDVDWGTVEGGYSLHRNQERLDRFLQMFPVPELRPDRAPPPSYLTPRGAPYEALVDGTLAAELEANGGSLDLRVGSTRGKGKAPDPAP